MASLIPSRHHSGGSCTPDATGNVPPIVKPGPSIRGSECSLSLWKSVVAVVLHVKDRLIEGINDLFGWWAGVAYDYSWTCIIISCLVTACLCAGFIPGIPKWIDGADPLYSLPYSLARSQAAVHRVLFNETVTRPSFVVVTGREPGENIFTWEHLEALQQLDRLIRGQIVDPKFRRRVAIPWSEAYPDRNDLHNEIPNTSDTVSGPTPGNSPALKVRRKSTSRSVDDNSNNMMSHWAPPGSLGLESPLLSVPDAPEYAGLINAFNNVGDEGAADRGDAGSDVITFQDICARNAFGECAVSSVLSMSVTDMRDLVLKPGDPPTLFVFNGFVFNKQKRAFPPHYFLGRAIEEPCTPELPRSLLGLVVAPEKLRPGNSPSTAIVETNCIRHAEAFQLIYEVSDRPEVTARNEAWEKALIDVLAEDNREFGPLRVTLSAFRSRDDALRSSTSESSDVLFVALMFALLILYSAFANFSCDLYRSKSYSALAGVGAAILGLLSGLGVMSLFGIAFVPTALVCPFLVVGVGIDDLFVVINSYCLSYMVDNARDRCVLALRDTGLAITVTTVTSLVSFSIGLNTGYLSIRNFCWFCNAGMLFGYIYVLCFFFPFLCLDAKREEERYACCFCSSGPPKNSRREARRRELQEAGVSCQDTADLSTFMLGALMCRRMEHEALYRYALRKYWARRRELMNSESPLDQKQHSATALEEALSPKGVILSSSSPAKCDPENRHCNVPTLQPLMRSLSDVEQKDNTGGMPFPDPKEMYMGTRKHGIFNAIRWQLKKIGYLFECIVDGMLATVALRAHSEGLKDCHDPAEATPSNGILLLPDLPHQRMTGDPIEDILYHPHIPLYYKSLITGTDKLYVEEPRGNVGRRWRKNLIKYFATFLVNRYVKLGILIGFGLFILLSAYGCLHLESGLDLRDLAPETGYLHRYDTANAYYFADYDFPVSVFFPEPTDWWRPEVQLSLRSFQARIEVSGTGKIVTNPLLTMLDDPELSPLLASGEPETFYAALYAAVSLEGGKYKQFEQQFVWEGRQLRSWKMQILPAGMSSSSERAAWMNQVRRDCALAAEQPEAPLIVMAWNYMMLFYESDLRINSSVITNMAVAAATMFLVAMVGLPQLLAGYCVILIMAMIDVGLIGFMHFWAVKLNMVSMICMLIAVGFCVDFSAHVCHTFMDARGRSRDQRAIEAVVLMGGPVLHGAATSLIGLVMLGFSSSYIFRVFYKMLTLVMLFALAHSVLFLPVLLTLVGDKLPHHLQHSGKAHKPKANVAALPPRSWSDDNTSTQADAEVVEFSSHERGFGPSRSNAAIAPSALTTPIGVKERRAVAGTHPMLPRDDTIASGMPAASAPVDQLDAVSRRKQTRFQQDTKQQAMMRSGLQRTSSQGRGLMHSDSQHLWVAAATAKKRNLMRFPPQQQSQQWRGPAAMQRGLSSKNCDIRLLEYADDEDQDGITPAWAVSEDSGSEDSLQGLPQRVASFRPSGDSKKKAKEAILIDQVQPPSPLRQRRIGIHESIDNAEISVAASPHESVNNGVRFCRSP